MKAGTPPALKTKAAQGSDVSRAAKEGGLLLTINGKTGWREVEIGRGSSALTCPVAMLETWMRLGRVADGPLFRRVTKKNTGVTSERLTDKHVARLVQKTALAAGIRGDLSEGERKLAFSGHSLRAGLASSAKIEEAHVQRHLGHASAEMTRRYQRKRDRFKVNLTRGGRVVTDRQILRRVCIDGQSSSSFAERAKSIGLPAGIKAQRVIAVRAAQVEPVRSLLITALGAGR